MRVAGISLLEFQVYLALTAVVALFLAQLLLLSHYAYDHIIFLADRQLVRAASYSMLTRVYEQADVPLRTRLNAGRLSVQVGQRHATLLDDVQEFSCKPDKDKSGILRGAWMMCDSDRWYCVNRKRALSCSWLLP